MKSIVFKALAVVALAGTNIAYAGAMTGDATLPEQIIQELTLTNQLTEQANTAENSFKNLTSGFSGSNALQGWQVSQITGQLTNLVNIIAKAQGVSYTAQNVAQQVKTTYGDPTQAIGNYQQQVATWTANTNSQIAQVLQQYKMNANDFQTQQQALNTIQQHSQTASGAMDLMQAGNQISGMLVTQIQKLQADVEAGNQLLANYIGQQTNMEAHRTDGLQNWLSGKSINSGSTSTGTSTASDGTGSTGTTTTATTVTGTTATASGSAGNTGAGTGTGTTGTTATTTASTSTGTGTVSSGTTTDSDSLSTSVSTGTGTSLACFSPGVGVCNTGSSSTDTSGDTTSPASSEATYYAPGLDAASFGP